MSLEQEQLDQFEADFQERRWDLRFSVIACVFGWSLFGWLLYLYMVGS